MTLNNALEALRKKREERRWLRSLQTSVTKELESRGPKSGYCVLVPLNRGNDNGK